MASPAEFDEREKYDHSGHSTSRRLPNDLKSPGNPDSQASADDMHPNNYPGGGDANAEPARDEHSK